MKPKALELEKLKAAFAGKDSFGIEDLHAFYKVEDPNVSKSTVHWRINSLIKEGVIQRIGRGIFRYGTSTYFSPQLSMKLFKINSLMKNEFPYLKYILWHISEVNFLAQHLVNKDFIFLEVEREAVDSVLERMKEKYKFVFKGRSREDVYTEGSVIIVRPLISDAPTQVVRNVPCTTIEKLLVDLFMDKEFYFLQGYELNHIYRNAFSKYTINLDKLLRYASRRAKRSEIETFIHSIK